MTKISTKISSSKRTKKRTIAETVKRTPTPDEPSKKCDSHILNNQGQSHEEGVVRITITDPRAIDKLAKTKPMEAAFQCRDALVTLNSGFNNRKHELLAAVCGIAYNMTAVEGEWKKFCKEDFWHSLKRRPKQSFRGTNKALRWVMRFVFQARTKNELNLTNRYAKMLEIEYNVGKSQSEIVDIIKNYGGIEGMRKARVASRKKSREKAVKWNTKEDQEFFDSLRDNSSDQEKRDYSISEKKHRLIRKALKKFCVESEAFFKKSIMN